jgi:hypothetical protein
MTPDQYEIEIARLNDQVYWLAQRNSNLLQLLSECLREGYLNDKTVSLSWLKAARKAVE